MQARSIVRTFDYLIEACWLLALIAVPIFFDTVTVRIFEPDKIVLFRNIVLIMVVLLLLRAIAAAPGAMRTGRRSDEDPAGPWWRAALRRRPLLVPVAVFTLVYIAATIHSVLPGISFWGSYDRSQGLYTWLNYIVFFLVLTYMVASWAQIERIISAIVFTSVPVAIYGVMQHLGWDPIAWGADTHIRVASTLGNAIFCGAYLIMCMPFAGYRLWRALERWQAPPITPAVPAGRGRGGRAPRRNRGEITITGLPPIIPVFGYAFVLLVDFAALYYTGSRGPYYGFIVAVFALGFPLMLKLNNPYPAMAGIGLAVLIFLFPHAASLPSALSTAAFVLALVVGLPLFFRYRRSSLLIGAIVLLVAVFSFPQAIDVLNPTPTAAATTSSASSDTSADGSRLTSLVSSTSEVRQFIWQGSIPLILHNPLLGWGPETMIYVYSPYYPSGLGHIERSNAAPDRNHDEWLDFLVFSGVLGLMAWLALLATFGFVAYRVLMRAQSRKATVLAAVIPAVVVGHLVEATVGIDIVSTLLLIWTMFALAAVLYARPALLETAPAPASPGPQATPPASPRQNARGSAAGRSRRAGQARPVAPAPTLDRLGPAQQGALLALIVATLVAIVGGLFLFANNVQVVRADAWYKQAQAYDAAGVACVAQARNPNDPAAAACPNRQLTGVQAANLGQPYIAQALSYYQQASAAQPGQDMYDLWTGKTYLDMAQYYLTAGRRSDAIQQFQNAESALKTAQSLNPRNADHPMNLARMYAGWASLDPSKWHDADASFKQATGLARHNGRWSDEWGRSDLLQADGRTDITPAQRVALYRQALAAFQHACQVDDLLGDARIYRGQAEQKLGLSAQALSSYQQGLKIGGFENFGYGDVNVYEADAYRALRRYKQAAHADTAALSQAQKHAQDGLGFRQTTPQQAVQGLIVALDAVHDYKALVTPVFDGQSPIALAYAPSVALNTTAFSPTLQAISNTLRTKGLIK